MLTLVNSDLILRPSLDVVLVWCGACAARAQIIWDDFIRFNWESGKRLRQAVSGKTGPNRWMGDGRLISLSLGRCTGPPVQPEFQIYAKNNLTSDLHIYGMKLQNNIIPCQFMILTFQ